MLLERIDPDYLSCETTHTTEEQRKKLREVFTSNLNARFEYNMEDWYTVFDCREECYNSMRYYMGLEYEDDERILYLEYDGMVRVVYGESDRIERIREILESVDTE